MRVKAIGSFVISMANKAKPRNPPKSFTLSATNAPGTKTVPLDGL